MHKLGRMATTVILPLIIMIIVIVIIIIVTWRFQFECFVIKHLLNRSLDQAVILDFQRRLGF